MQAPDVIRSTTDRPAETPEYSMDLKPQKTIQDFWKPSVSASPSASQRPLQLSSQQPTINSAGEEEDKEDRCLNESEKEYDDFGNSRSDNGN